MKSVVFDTLIKMAEDLEDFNTVNYAAWHFPCYRKLNCPKRNYVGGQNTEAVTAITSESDNEPANNADMVKNLSAFDFSSTEELCTFVFIFVTIVVTVLGCAIMFGALCHIKRGGAARPYNQVSYIHT